jgi:putative CocE/NonD family hydrolase
LSDPNHYNVIVAGPWYHGQWHAPKAESIGLITFGGHDTATEFREQIEAPWFQYWLHGKGEKVPWEASTFQTGSNVWRTYAAWPPKATTTNLYLRANGALSFDAPGAVAAASGGPGSPAVPASNDAFVQYVSDPAHPVPYRQRPISPTYPEGDWRRWEVADQRFVDGRPDVATWVSAPLDRDLTVTGELSADLFASTSGSDSDFVVKLIDVYPENAQADAWAAGAGPAPGQYAQSLNGYQLPIAMEVRRGRYNRSYEHPQALVPNEPTEFVIPLRSHDHVFLKAHRIMVQVQSTWFPLIDRNPQKFVPSIYDAKAEDFVIATQRIHTSRERPSHIVLPVVSTSP